ncbi:MAG: hypothetical protein ABL962_04060 [Fimbriimonadaceae bacterium]
MKQILLSNNWRVLAATLLLCCGCFGVILYKPILSAREASPHVQCLSNMKQLGTATAIYLADANDRMPLDNWMSALYPYTKNAAMMNCSELVREDKHFGYAYKFGLSGLDSTLIKTPENTVLYFETDALAKDLVVNLAARTKTRHEGLSGVSFVDTHAKRLPADAKLK